MYEILDDYHLSDPNKIEEKVASLDEPTLKELFKEIQGYYDRNLRSIISSFQSQESMNIYPSGLLQYPETRFVRFSKRLCLYADKIVVHDPIYGILRSMDLGFKVEYVKSRLKQILEHCLELRGLVEEEILYYVPYEKIVIPANKEICEAARADWSNPGFKKICHQNLEVGLDRVKTDELSYSVIFARLGLKSPSRVSVGFHFSGSKGPVGFKMGPGRPFEIKTAGKSIEVKPLRVSESVIETDEQIKNHIEQFLLGTAMENVSSLYLSKLFNACSITNFDVMWKLLNWKFGNIGEEPRTISTLHNIDLKFLDNISINNILKVRRKEKSAFEDFRQYFREFCQEIKSMPETENFKKEILKLRKEKIDPQLRKLDREFGRIKRHRFVRGAAIGIGTLSGAAVLGPAVMPVLTGGLIALLREYSEYDKERDKLKENSLYFLWKLKSS